MCIRDRIITELNTIRRANSNYASYVQLRKTAEEYAEDRDAMITHQVSFIQTTINDKMREITARILKSKDKVPPRLTIEKLSKYTLETKEDGGSGALMRALITFDQMCIRDRLHFVLSFSAPPNLKFLLDFC